MSDTGGEGCCRCCCSFIFSLGLTALFMWLSLRTSNPKCSIQNFYLPSLNRTLNDRSNHTLNLMLQLDNPNKDKGIKYDTLNVTVYDSHNRSHVIGNILVPAFYQGHKKKAKKYSTVNANTTVALQGIFENGTGIYRVDMSTSVKFKIMFWYTKRHKIMVGADLVVNGTSGSKVDRKGIKLKSMAARTGSFCVVMGSLVSFLVFVLLNSCNGIGFWYR